MMKRLLLSLPVLFLVACGAKEGNNNNDHGNEGHNEAGHEDGKDGDKGHNEAGHEEGGHGHGKPQTLGKMKAHGRECTIIQLGDIHAGEEAYVEVEFASAADRIATTRAWFGVESGEGSMKAKFELEGDKNLHGHIDVPSPIPADSKLWLSFDLDGKVETHSIAFK